MNIKEIAKNTTNFLKEYSPNIFTGLSIVGAVSAVVMAVKATPIALEEIKKRKKDKKDEVIWEHSDEDLSEEELEELSKLKTSDYIKACWKVYLPTALMLGTTVGASVASNCIMTKRHGALITAYGASQEAIREYQRRVIEKIGPKKEQEIRDEIAKEKVKGTYTGVYDPNAVPGDQVFYDGYSGRWFKCKLDRIRMAEANFNNLINDESFASINDFYDLINVPELKHISPGELGYHTGEKININYVAAIKEDTGVPYIILDYGYNVKEYKGG